MKERRCAEQNLVTMVSLHAETRSVLITHSASVLSEQISTQGKSKRCLGVVLKIALNL